MAMKEIPVYLFVGFLESGKTRFIQETLEDPQFDSGDKTLLLVCEEGEEEYNPGRFAFGGVQLEVLADKSELNPAHLEALARNCGAGRVVLEYNGMWLMQELAEALPPNWIIYQCIATADGTTFQSYFDNMRQLMLDKFARSELLVVNRAEAVDTDEQHLAIHKAVRQASRRCDIAYEYADGRVAYDEIPDPLPLTWTPRWWRSRTRILASGIWTATRTLASTRAKRCGLLRRYARPRARARTPLFPAGLP